ncbi:hypothetical protein [Nonomuraea fuscirosea]|uniref:hypothetical protein n=1 Tax=Nonomuraea fuscirosea TaxID=1291556 RepID=UPI000D05FCFF|nr:hypothetical protein [Nonomuraea fuscirosea]
MALSRPGGRNCNPIPPLGWLNHLGDPKNRLAHGRVAQTLLVAPIVTVANDHFLDAWRHQHDPGPAVHHDDVPDDGHPSIPPTKAGKPPPDP